MAMSGPRRVPGAVARPPDREALVCTECGEEVVPEPGGYFVCLACGHRRQAKSQDSRKKAK
jgi:DNA-directed RNA polymerase subunit RPC12/RpoP